MRLDFLDDLLRVKRKKDSKNSEQEFREILSEFPLIWQPGGTQSSPDAIQILPGDIPDPIHNFTKFDYPWNELLAPRTLCEKVGLENGLKLEWEVKSLKKSSPSYGPMMNGHYMKRRMLYHYSNTRDATFWLGSDCVSEEMKKLDEEYAEHEKQDAKEWRDKFLALGSLQVPYGRKTYQWWKNGGHFLKSPERTQRERHVYELYEHLFKHHPW